MTLCSVIFKMPTPSWVSPCQTILLGRPSQESPHGGGSSLSSPHLTAVGSERLGCPAPGLTPDSLQPALCYNDEVSPCLRAAPPPPELMEPQRNETKATECQRWVQGTSQAPCFLLSRYERGLLLFLLRLWRLLFQFKVRMGPCWRDSF